MLTRILNDLTAFALGVVAYATEAPAKPAAPLATVASHQPAPLPPAPDTVTVEAPQLPAFDLLPSPCEGPAVCVCRAQTPAYVVQPPPAKRRPGRPRKAVAA